MLLLLTTTAASALAPPASMHGARSTSRRGFLAQGAGAALLAATAPGLSTAAVASVAPRPPPAAAATVLPHTTTSLAAAPSAGVEFWSGLLAGAVQKTAKELALHPLDTAKARLQYVGGSRRLLLGELFAAPYAGLAPALISGAPAASAFFAVKDATKRAAVGLQLGKPQTTILAVVCANVAYWGVKNPSEVLKVRRQAGVAGETVPAARALWEAEGLGGFYSSYVPNYSYSTPVDVTKFLLYEQVKAALRAQRGGASPSPLEAALGGAIAASTAQALATPLDVARVRIMTDDAAPPDVVGTVRAIAADEGLGALYSGVAPKVVRALASGAIQFSTYEATKQWSVDVLARRFPQL